MKANKNISVFILCGGKSSRMKTEKGLVHFKGKSFMQRILEAVVPISENIYLITGNNDYARFGFPLIADIFPENGPMGGIYTALSYSTTQLNLVLSCDIPKITTPLLKKLVSESHATQEEICFLSDRENEYPLIGIYSRKVLPALKAALLNEELRLRQFVKNQRYKSIPVALEEEGNLKNINTREALENLI